MLIRTTFLGLLTAALVASAAPTYAGSGATRDPGGDVVSRSQFSDAPPTRTEPARKLGDVVSSKVTLGADLVVTLTLRSLAARGHQQFQWTVVTSADEEPGGWTGVLVYDGSRRGLFDFLDPVANDSGCARARVDRPARRVTLTVPAGCLGDPDWVKVGIGTMTMAGGREYWDDAHRDTYDVRRLRLGPKVLAQ